ncbi:MAG: DNA mismatch repair endonuclease MutL, partial [Paramuribaculum sp.]|nr:DNA mismatch repair endonuclease MutL [Paramuribaculum sp.]
FFNVPVRRKFLKRDSVELSNILREFERLALVNPGLDFEFVNNDSTMHRMIGSSMKQRILDLFGKGLDKQLLPVSTSTPIVSIEGFIGRPENARKRNALQYLMVNGRHMRHPYFHKAILTCFEKLIPSDSQPNYFLCFTVDPHTIDVNIHPTKNEIKFENETPIWQILTAAVKEAIGKFNAGPGIDFDVVDAPEIPVFRPDKTAEHSIEIDTTYNPFRQESAAGPSSWSGGDSFKKAGIGSDWDQLYEEFLGQPTVVESKISGMPSPGMDLGDLKVGSAEATLIPDDSMTGRNGGKWSDDEVSTIQVNNRFIVSATSSGLMVVDQHRAHVKILYEQFVEQLSGSRALSQRVMFPEVFSLTSAQSAVLTDITEKLSDCGFELSFLGGDSWSISAQPMLPDGVNPVEALTAVIDDYRHSRHDDDIGKWRETVALSLARSGAVRGGTKLGAEEREHLMAQLLRLPTPNYTPDGKLIISVISTDDLSGMLR